MSELSEIRKVIKRAGSSKRAKSSAWFFKTGKGQYGYGDVFVGITVPEQRKIAKRFFNTFTLKDTVELLKGKIHEERFIALEILVMKFENAIKQNEKRAQKQIVDLYLKSTKHINNWDLVDTSAPYILGEYLLSHPRQALKQLAKSNSLWERRIAIVSTMRLIANNEFADTLKVSKLLLSDNHDLIHKAVGWMLREVGKRDIKLLKKFLKENISRLPRTTLGYAIERFPEAERKKFLAL